MNTWHDEAPLCKAMPRQMVQDAWESWHGSLDAIYLADIKEWRSQIRSQELLAELASRVTNRVSDSAEDEILMEYKIQPIADKFEVSAQAMRIRLEKLGLLLRRKENLLF